MSKKQKKFKSKIDGKEYLILIDDVQIMQKSLNELSAPSGLHFYFDDNSQLHYDIFDRPGHKIDSYLIAGYDSTPSFFVSSGSTWFKIDVDDPNKKHIEPLPLTEISEIKSYISGSFYSLQSSASGWLILVKKEGIDINPISK